MSSDNQDKHNVNFSISDQQTREEVLALYDRGVQDSQDEDELSGRTKRDSEFSTLQGKSEKSDKSETEESQMVNSEEGPGGPPSPFVVRDSLNEESNTDDHV